MADSEKIIGQMLRVLLDPLKGHQLVDISADESDTVLLFDNGDTLSFGYFSYRPMVGKEDLDKKIKAFVADHPEFFIKESDDDDDDN